MTPRPLRYVSDPLSAVLRSSRSWDPTASRHSGSGSGRAGRRRKGTTLSIDLDPSGQDHHAQLPGREHPGRNRVISIEEVFELVRLGTTNLRMLTAEKSLTCP